MANARRSTAPDSTGPNSRSGRRLAPELGGAEAVLEYVSFAARPLSLSLLLDEAPWRIARIMRADVASIYLVEGHGQGMVMRGNVGFAPKARGQIRLEVGEGLTGMAVEFLRPIKVTRAPEHQRFRDFEELDEEAFPVFLAIPIVGTGRALGALVLQRRGELAFSDRDVELASALTAPISSAIRHAQVLDELRDKQARRSGVGTRKITLPGMPVVPGRALGALASFRRPGRRSAPVRDRGELRRVQTAFEAARKAIDSLLGRAGELKLGPDALFLETYRVLAQDARLKQRTAELVKEGASAKEALNVVARDAVRAATGPVGDPFLEERARDIEDYCDAVAMLTDKSPEGSLPARAVLIGEQISVFDVITSSRSHPAGVVLTSPGHHNRSMVLLKLLGLPSVVDVQGAFRWVSPGDVVLVDADHGLFVINPSRMEIASVRGARNETAE